MSSNHYLYNNLRYNYNKNVLARYLVIILFFISPLLSLPFVFVEIYNKRRYAQTLVALFFALSAWLFPPIMDLYRHFLSFLKINDNPYALRDLLEDKSDFLLYYLNRFYGYLGLPFEIVKFTLTFLTYEIIFWIFRDIIKKNKSLNKYYFLIFCIFVLSVHYTNLVTGLRSIFSATLFTLGIYLLVIKQKSGYFFLLSACFTHYTYYFYLIPFIIMIKTNIQISNRNLIIFSLIIITFFNPLLLEKIMNLPFIPNFISGAMNAYLFGKFSSNQLDTHNFNYFVLYLIGQIPVWILAYYNIFLSNNNFGRISRLSLLLLIFLSQVSFILYDRFSAVFLYLSIFAILLYYRKNLQKILVIIFISLFISRIGLIYTFRKELSISYEYTLATPIPWILYHQYTPSWVFSHIDNEGFIR